jgi:hypothetical protein
MSAAEVKPATKVVATVSTGRSLDVLSRVIQEFFGSIAATLCGTPRYTQAG